MEVHRTPVLNIFDTKQRLEIPLFQRQYVWNEEEQWQPLWEDIQRKFAEAVEGEGGAPNHFLGAMVLDQKQTPTGHVLVRQVIDGQQRLTTLQIFLAAFRDFCREYDCEELGNEVNQSLFNKGMMANPDVDQFKVWPTNLDRKQFVDVISAGSRLELLKRHPTRRQKYARNDDPKPRMVEAYFFFFSALKDFFVGTGGDEVAGAEHSIAIRLEECLRSMRSALLVVVIDLDSGDDPQVIFETLNARGQPLLPADLIRNYIFLRARRDNLDTEKMYEEHWCHFDDEFWREEVRQGRLNRPRSDIFIQHLLASRQGRDIPIKHLYAEYRHWSEKKETQLGVLEELKLISEQSQNFRRLLSADADDPIAPLADFLSVFDVSTIYPLLLSFFESEPSNDEWAEIGRILESYIVRRAVCDLGTKNYNKLFLSAARNLRREGFTAQNLAQFLKSQSGESGIWPDDNQFKEGWLNNEVYRPLGSGRLVHILSRLDQRYGSAKSETIKFEVRPTVEHIMPQSWQKHWPLPNGEKGLTFAELQDADEGDKTAIETRERNRTVQRMGNLTILSQSLNPGVSNLGWDLKLPELKKHSLLPINLELHSSDDWTDTKISKRGVSLFGHAVEIWQR
ncbi:DUF262 domain-containing protein [Loktanella salsilacus]|uniref:DUF262 domain-containing protein n=1 Tax=Loktanella salsilacus TaxID=195913 RepID=UPI0020B8E0D3|nr:DUF262 domain-containing protein [Loktanella salsilacus]UTH45331.1 DUF262 domain-containing protein [Loktanella salsilacus]